MERRNSLDPAWAPLDPGGPWHLSSLVTPLFIGANLSLSMELVYDFCVDDFDVLVSNLQLIIENSNEKVNSC